jgi:hypothetical protein
MWRALKELTRAIRTSKLAFVGAVMCVRIRLSLKESVMTIVTCDCCGRERNEIIHIEHASVVFAQETFAGADLCFDCKKKIISTISEYIREYLPTVIKRNNK